MPTLVDANPFVGEGVGEFDFRLMLEEYRLKLSCVSSVIVSVFIRGSSPGRVLRCFFLLLFLLGLH